MFDRLKDWRRVATRYHRCPTAFFSAITLAARRIATRYDKTASSFFSFLLLAAAKLWLTHYVNKGLDDGRVTPDLHLAA